MQTKFLEIRDEGTCILALAMKMAPDVNPRPHPRPHPIHDWFLRRSGYPRDGSSIMLMRLADGRATNDPYEWPTLTRDNRTMPNAHHWILQHYDELTDGDVVDVQFLLGETARPKLSERLTAPTPAPR